MPDNVSISYTGIQTIRAVDASFARGITPSVFTITCMPFDNLDPLGGTLTLTSGQTQIQFTDCAIAAAYVKQRSDGLWPLWSVQVYDRRWKWKNSVISGDYNRRQLSGLVDPLTQKTPAELANLLLNALGESGYDTSKMPSNVRPRALWSATRADLALQALCDSVACEVVLNHLTNRVEIWPLGTGSSATTGEGNVLPKYRYVPRSNVPEKIEVHGGETLFENRLKLVAVGRNYNFTNGYLVQKKLNDLEWKPADGFTDVLPWSMNGITNSNYRPVAFDTLWRDYRLLGQENGNTAVPNSGVAVNSIDQYLLNDCILVEEKDLDDKARKFPCFLDGDYWAYGDLPSSTDDQPYVWDFQLNAERRLVRLPFPLFKLSSTGTFTEPELYLTTSYRIKDPDGKVVSLKREGAGAGGSGTLVLKRPELFATYRGAVNTLAQANQEADSYIALFRQKYANPSAAEVIYGGFKNQSLDGNIAQITWSLSINSAPTTRICEHEELDVGAVSRNERRRREKLEAIG